ncbi:MAG: helix-turn-helix transcriptional regulator [Deltaproteobacteria bacterium]|nr:helix-turn-helix transcriptional regulator [Deltaproteobacteria bacterium]
MNVESESEGSATPDLLETLHEWLQSRLVDEDVRIEAAAAALGLSKRKLQRELAARDTTYSAELDGVRRSRAKSLIAGGLKITCLSHELGFKNPQSIHKAFRRWESTTPARWRSAARAEIP